MHRAVRIAAALVLVLAFLAFVVSSAWSVRVEWDGLGHHWLAWLTCGQLRLGMMGRTLWPGEPPTFEVASGLGIEWPEIGLMDSPAPGFVKVTLPTPLLLLVVTIAVAVTLRRTGPRRVQAGHCTRCGYDLRSSPACCPECGVPVISGSHRAANRAGSVGSSKKTPGSA